MKYKYLRTIILFIMIFVIMESGSSQDLVLPEGFPEYEVIRTEDVSPGYAFLSIQPSSKKESWLVVMDSYGTPVYYRYFAKKTTYFQLQPSGYLNFSEKTATASTTAIMDSTFTIIDRVPIQNGYRNNRHDFIHSEDGEFILIGMDPVVMDLSEVVEGGSTDATVTGCVVQVQNSEKEVVLDWNSRDYFNITDSYADLTASSINDVHPNSIELDLDGNILLISRAMNEVTKIDRTTGDIIWRFGGKNNQFTFTNEADAFSMPHDIRVLKNGNYTLFDNGNTREPQFSRAIEYKLDTENMTATKVWEYCGDSTIYTSIKGSTQRLENGNTIIGYGALDKPGVIEVTPDGKIAWHLNYAPGGSANIVVKHPWKTSLFSTNTDTVNFGEWNGYTHSVYILSIKNNSDKELQLSNYHLHTNAFILDNELFPMTLAPNEEKSIHILYFPDEINSSEVNDVLTINSDINNDKLIQRIAVQVHLTGTKFYSSIASNSIDNVKVFPNPAHDLLTISSPKHLIGQVCVYSLNGSMVYKNNIIDNKTTIDITGLEKGIYIIEIFDESLNKYYRKKIVKL